jgi:hypothetical protein
MLCSIYSALLRALRGIAERARCAAALALRIRFGIAYAVFLVSAVGQAGYAGISNIAMAGIVFHTGAHTHSTRERYAQQY